MCYDASVFGVTQTPLPENCRKVDKIVKDENGQDVNLGPYPIESHRAGQGYHISTFQPKQPLRRNKLIENSFTPALQWNAAAQLEMVQLARDKAYFPFGINTSMGDYSWDLPMDKISKQKPCKFQLFDPSLQYFPRGSHAPLMIFLGSSSDGRRSTPADRRRAAKADARGWTRQRRKAAMQWSTSQSSTSQWSSSEWSSSEWHGAWSSSEWHGS